MMSASSQPALPRERPEESSPSARSPRRGSAAWRGAATGGFLSPPAVTVQLFTMYTSASRRPARARSRFHKKLGQRARFVWFTLQPSV